MASLPERREDLVALAGNQNLVADAVAVNRAIIARSPQDIPAHNQLGHAGVEHARVAFETVLRLDSGNAIAAKWVREISRSKHAHRRPG